jgi:hypothetical protein
MNATDEKSADVDADNLLRTEGIRYSDLLPQSKSLTATYFADNVIVPLARRRAEQRSGITSQRMHLCVDNSK